MQTHPANCSSPKSDATLGGFPPLETSVLCILNTVFRFHLLKYEEMYRMMRFRGRAGAERVMPCAS